MTQPRLLTPEEFEEIKGGIVYCELRHPESKVLKHMKAMALHIEVQTALDAWQPLSSIPKNVMVLIAWEFDVNGTVKQAVSEGDTHDIELQGVRDGGMRATAWKPMPLPPKAGA